MVASGLNVGDEAPDISGTLVYPDRPTTETALSTLLDSSPVLLCFYTNDFSPDCIREWCQFRDYNWFATSEHFQVIGVSKSRPFTHRRFINHLDLQFPLFSDIDLTMTDAFNVKYRAFKVLPRPRRSCFLIDTDGTIKYTWIGDHPIDPTRDVPSLEELHEVIQRELDIPSAETFGL